MEIMNGVKGHFDESWSTHLKAKWVILYFSKLWKNFSRDLSINGAFVACLKFFQMELMVNCYCASGAISLILPN